MNMNVFNRYNVRIKCYPYCSNISREMNLYSVVLLLVYNIWCVKEVFCKSTNVSINDNNCGNNQTWTVTTYQPSVVFNVVFNTRTVSKDCLLYVFNKDFQGNKVYELSVEVTNNASLYHNTIVGIYIGHPDLNKPITKLTVQSKKWRGHIPSWDVYLNIHSCAMPVEFNINVTIQECNENCYELTTPSIIPTHIVNVPDQCDDNHCLDNYAVSFHIRSNFVRPQPCSLYFMVQNYPSICITIGDHWVDSVIKGTKCRRATLRIGNEIYATFDRLIFKPWCLPWRSNFNRLSVTWDSEFDVSVQHLCTLTLYTNTTKRGECSLETTPIKTETSVTRDNTKMMTSITVTTLSVMVILTIVIVVFIIKRKKRVEDGEFVANFHHHSSISVVSPPPYSVAVPDTLPPYENGTVTINPGQHNGVNFHRQTSDTDTCLASPNCVLDLPPPYNES